MHDHLALLIAYQKWRRGDNSIAQPHPKEIGKALDWAMRAELAELKAPPKVLSAEEVEEEVEEEGWYWSVDNEEFVQIDCDPTILPWQLSMWRVSSSVCSRLQGQFIGPIQMPGV